MPYILGYGKDAKRGEPTYKKPVNTEAKPVRSSRRDDDPPSNLPIILTLVALDIL